MTLSGDTTPGQTGQRINGNEGILRIYQNSNIVVTSPSECFMPYPGHSLQESNHSVEM